MLFHISNSKMIKPISAHAMDQRKDRVSGNAMLGCIPPDDDAKVGATLIRFLLKATSLWSFVSLGPDALPGDAGEVLR